MHWKRVTCELHGSYFRLMTIKHSISKIEWALNYYIAQSRRKSSASCSGVGDGGRREVVGKATPGRRGPREPWLNWGPEKMLIRCSKGSHHPAEWAQGLWLSSPGERERHNVTAIRVRVKILQFLFDLQLPLTRKPRVTLFEPLQ